jgi:iron complex outermembrane receptor protein
MGLQSAIQKEYGVRYQGMDNRLMVTVAYFDIKQDNFSVPNPANLVVPAPVPLLPALLSNRKAKGWEFEFRANLTSQLSLIGNYTTFSNRDGNNVQFRGTAEKSGAGLLSYRFAKTGKLAGLSIAVGEEYVGRRPGDSAPGPITVTPSTGSPYLVIPQPTFWVGAHFLTNVGVTYKINRTWTTQLNVDNVFNKDYIAAAVNRANVIPGTPINARFKVVYNF